MLLIRIEPQSPEPIFEQIAFQVKAAVAKGDATEGEKLPSVRELARELSINPNTVVRAYDALEHEGIILRRKGSGCFLTGRGSELSEERKLRDLAELMRKAATEAFHLGFGSEAILAALTRQLEELQFDDGASQNRNGNPR